MEGAVEDSIGAFVEDVKARDLGRALAPANKRLCTSLMLQAATTVLLPR